LKLDGGEQRLASGAAQPCFAPGYMKHLDLIETGEQNRRRVSLHNGLRGKRVGFLPVKFE